MQLGTKGKNVFVLSNRISGQQEEVQLPTRLETRLHDEYREQRRLAKKVKKWWFITRAKQLMSELYPTDVDRFKYSPLRRFRRRFGVSLRATTHTAQQDPQNLENVISSFHRRLIEARKDGQFAASDVANMDQTPLPFILDDNTRMTACMVAGKAGVHPDLAS